MKNFMDQDFLLETDSAKVLYHEYAKSMPILDYHCHLSPQEIWENQPYENISEVWLGADHYKWRAMRSNGIPEDKITGKADSREKFQAWAETVEQCLGNPLYHWTHLELQRYFDIYETLDSNSAGAIWQKCNALLTQEGFRPRDFMAKSNVELVCTTDDPCDDLAFHQKLKAEPTWECRVLPTFRPDQAVNIEREGFCAWLKKLGIVVGYEVNTLDALKKALASRIAHFAEHGCRISDHGMDEIYYEAASDAVIQRILEQRLADQVLSSLEIAQYKTAIWCFLGLEYAKRSWVMQLHIGAQRNNNRRMLASIGADAGFDSIGDASVAKPLAAFLNHLDERELLPKTVLYTINSRDNEVLATMIGNFQRDTPGKMQFGSAWWFHDQRDGMELQMRSLANLGLLTRFVGMLTDSRSFLSYPRHEYFRRILCNLIGRWVENGEYPADKARLGQIVENICYYNAKRYLALGFE
ncbi:MAG: glucuronate isomerase [Spirochaetota bacterium]